MALSPIGQKIAQQPSNGGILSLGNQVTRQPNLSPIGQKIDMSIFNNQPQGGQSIRPLPGSTISQAPQVQRAPFVQIAQALLPKPVFQSFDEHVVSKISPLKKVIAPSFSDQLKTAQNEKPNQSTPQLVQRAKELDTETGMTRVGDNLVDPMGIGGSMKRVVNKPLSEAGKKVINSFADLSNGVKKMSFEEGTQIRSQVQKIADELQRMGRITKEEAIAPNKNLADTLKRISDEEPKAPISQSLQKPVKQEARPTPAKEAIAKRMTEDEFVKGQTPDTSYQGGHQPTPGTRSFDLTELVDGEEVIPKDMYSQWYGSRGTPEDLQSIAVLKKIKGNPEAEVTIYRAGPSKDFNNGDWVTFSKKYADGHAIGNVEAGKSMQVYSKVVKAKDVRWAMDDVNEFGFYPSDIKTTSQLRAEYQAAKGTPIQQEAKQAILQKPKGTSEAQRTRIEKNVENPILKQIQKGSTDGHFADAKDALQKAKGLSAQDITKRHPDINLKRDVPVTDIYGKKSVIPAGEALTPYELKGNKVLLQDGETYIVSKNQAQNVMSNAVKGEAPTLKKPSGILQLAKDYATELKRQPRLGLSAEDVTKGLKPDSFDKAQKVSPIDRLIAENKVRVVSRDGRDVYQVKKGGQWVNKRDESSTLASFEVKTKAPVLSKPKSQLSDALEQKKLAIEIQQEALDNNPAKQLSKNISTRGEFKGGLREGVDDQAKSAGFDSAEEARDAYDAYKVQKVRLQEDRVALRKSIEQEKSQGLLAKAMQKPVAVVKAPVSKTISKAEVATLEEQAQQALGEVRLPQSEKPLSLEKIITPQTPVGKKVNFIDWLRTPDRVLRKIGFGKEADLLRDQYEKYVMELPKNMATIKAWSKRVPPASSKRIFQYLDGEKIALSPAEQKVATEIQAYLKNWANRLKLPEDNRVTNYITHLFDEQLIAKEFDEDLAKIIADKVPGAVYDPFLLKRLGAKGYKQDVWGALDAYTKRATRKVHMDPALERIQEKAGSSLEFSNIEKTQFDFIQHYIERVNLRPTNTDTLVDNSIKSIIGYRFGQRPLTNLLRVLRKMTYSGMLGGNLSSAIRNLSQGVNTYATLGEKYTTIGYAKLFNPSSHAELEAQGILANTFIEDRTLSTTKNALKKLDKALFVFFDTAERINRGAAYFGAKSKGLNKGMSEDEAIKYAKKIVRNTQFNYDVVDQPQMISSDIVKTFAQFMSYPIKQTEFLAGLVKDKNLAGVIRYAIGGAAFVYTVGQAMGMDMKELLPFSGIVTGDQKFGTTPSMKLPVEVVKAVVDAPNKYGGDRTTEQKLKDIGKSAVGLIPGGVQIKKTYEGLKANREGGVFTNSGDKQFETGQTTGSKIQNALFGKYSGKNAKDHFDGVKTPEQKLKAKKLEESKKEREVIQPIFDKVQALTAEGKDEEVQKVLDDLTDTQYDTLISIRASYRSKNTEAVRLKLELDPKEAMEYIRTLPEQEANRIVETILTDEEFDLLMTGK